MSIQESNLKAENKLLRDRVQEAEKRAIQARSDAMEDMFNNMTTLVQTMSKVVSRQGWLMLLAALCFFVGLVGGIFSVISVKVIWDHSNEQTTYTKKADLRGQKILCQNIPEDPTCQEPIGDRE